LYEDKQHRLWLGTNDGLYEYNPGATSPIEEVNSLCKASISDIAEWGEYLLVATRGKGVVFYKPGATLLVTEDQGLLSNTIECIAVDGDNRIWIGTAKGMQCINALGVDPEKTNP
jgi:ligand-binding sensor domain-containing protein